MTTLVANAGTILDVVNGIGPDGNLLSVAEVLYKEIPIFQNAVWTEANDTTQHKYSRTKALPKSERIRFNKGLGSSLGYNEQVSTVLSGRGNRPYIDARVVNASPNKDEYLNGHIRKSILGIGQEFASDMFYSSNKADADAFDGLAEFTSTTGDLVLSAGHSSATDNTSMYIVCWGVNEGAYMAYPRFSQAGLKFTDYGMRPKDVDGKALDVYEHSVEITGGLCLADPRSVARICNIDVSGPSATSFDENAVIKVLNRLPANLRNKAVAYVSRNVMAAIQMRANAKSNVYYSSKEVFGNIIPTIGGMEIRLDESISENEDVVA